MLLCPLYLTLLEHYTLFDKAPQLKNFWIPSVPTFPRVQIPSTALCRVNFNQSKYRYINSKDNSMKVTKCNNSHFANPNVLTSRSLLWMVLGSGSYECSTIVGAWSVTAVQFQPVPDTDSWLIWIQIYRSIETRIRISIKFKRWDPDTLCGITNFTKISIIKNVYISLCKTYWKVTPNIA